MALYYHHTHALTALFPELYRLVKAERKHLKAQTPQTIVVGNLDVEAWLQEKFIAADGVLMGVHFPFLETALETFSERLTSGNFPGSHESWFSAPHEKKSSVKKAGILQLELALLNFIADPENSAFVADLGYEMQAAGPMQTLALAQKLAREIREYLLHVPDLMQSYLSSTRRNLHPIGRLWKILHAELAGAGYVSQMLLLNTKPPRGGTSLFASGALFLFGMPVLSAYHIRMLCRIAGTVDVHILALNLTTGSEIRNSYYSAVAATFVHYTNFIKKTARETGTEFIDAPVVTPLRSWQKNWLHAENAAEDEQSPVQFLGLPGMWRGAELLGDAWHAAMRNDSTLRQDDLAVSLTDAAAQFPAFDKACGARRLSAFTRNRLYERPAPLVELVAIFAAAVTEGIDRHLVIRYLGNAVVRDRFGLDAENTAVFIAALADANGFRNDYPGGLGVFNFNAAMQRIQLGLVIDPEAASEDAGMPAAAYIRALDSAENLAAFTECMQMLLGPAQMLVPQNGAALVKLLGATLAKFRQTPSPDFSVLENMLGEIATLVRAEKVSLQQIAKILTAHAPGKPLSQSTARQGICISPFSSPVFLRSSLTIFDLNEEMDTSPENEEKLLPEYLKSPTRLNAEEQTAISLIHAALSNCDDLKICYSRIDPQTGAEKYRSLAAEKFKASLTEKKIRFSEEEDFPATILETDRPKRFANAADSEVMTMRLATAAAGTAGNHLLSEKLLPPVPAQGAAHQIPVRNLSAYLQNPLRQALEPLTALPEDPADFGYAEPKLAESKGARLRFAENYLLKELLNPGNREPADPLSVLGALKNRGAAEPEGFDFMHRLLSQGENANLLRNFATDEKSQTRLCEIIFEPRIVAPFTIAEGPRLERRYLPSPCIAGLMPAGSVGKFILGDDGYLLLLGSAIYEQRTAALLAAYLHLSLMQLASAAYPVFMPAGIRLSQYEIESDTQSVAPVLQIENKIKFTLEAAKITNARAYLEKLLLSLHSGKRICFDADLLGKNKLGGFAAKSDDEILAALSRGSEQEKDFLTQFYGLQCDTDSVAFFNELVRPVAALDTDKTPRKAKR